MKKRLRKKLAKKEWDRRQAEYHGIRRALAVESVLSAFAQIGYDSAFKGCDRGETITIKKPEVITWD